MTNLEKYNKILKRNLQATDEDLNDDVLVYNRFKRWESVRHVDMVADLEEAFGVFFETLDITSFQHLQQRNRDSGKTWRGYEQIRDFS